jgi:preprotein translocase subunit SecA
MSSAAAEVYTVFDARRVKQPELKNTDIPIAWLHGKIANRIPVLPRLKKFAAQVETLEKDIHNLSSTLFREEVDQLKQDARVNKLIGDKLIRAFALVREGAWRSVGKRPYPVQLMGAMALFEGRVIEMATGEGKTLTAALGASLMSWAGKPVHVITVNDYLVARDAELNKPLYDIMGSSVGFVTHETEPHARIDMYRRGVVYSTSKELVADFLRDQIMLGTMRSGTQTAVSMLQGAGLRTRMLVPGLFRAIIDEADSLLIDEAVTPLIISNSPNDEANAERYRRATALADKLEDKVDFKIDRQVRTVDLTQRGKDRLDQLNVTEQGFWAGSRRAEELVTQALVAKYCFHLDEHYLITDEGKIVIIDEFTGRVMADRSWRHGLHQAIEIKEGVKVTADKENLARISFQRFFRQYPQIAGMTGTCKEAAGEIWMMYRRTVVKIPTNKPNIRKQLPIRFFDSSDQKWDAVVERIVELNDKKVPVLVGTRSVWASEEIAKRLDALGRSYRLLNARQDKTEADTISQAGQIGAITVATNMAGRGTDIHLEKGVAEMGGLHVIATEPHSSSRIDRQLFGRAARQGDPGCAQMFACADDDLFKRHAQKLRKAWRLIGANNLIRFAQAKAEHIARFNRKQVLKADEWTDQAVPF